MAQVITKIGDTTVLLEAPASSGISKSDAEMKAEPQKAIANCMNMVKLVAAYFNHEVGPVIRKLGGSIELSFAIRSDSLGNVMIAQDSHEGQFQLKLVVSPPPPRPRPPGPRPTGGPRPRPQRPPENG